MVPGAVRTLVHHIVSSLATNPSLNYHDTLTGKSVKCAEYLLTFQGQKEKNNSFRMKNVDV